MADASPESIQRLIENSEKRLVQMEMSQPLVLKARRAVDEIGLGLRKNDNANVNLNDNHIK